MNIQLQRCSLALPCLVLLFAAGCGGGGSSDSTAPPVVVVPPPTTTNVTTTVVDGALKNALVCLDKNGNGKCDADETQGRTDAAGVVTLAIANADVGKHPILALVGTDAVDADNGAVTVAYALSTPADQTAVVSPLTTLVQQAIASTGATTAEAAQSLRDTAGINVSLFQDYTKVPAPTDGSTSAAAVARFLVLLTQQQQGAVAATVGTTAIDGGTISQADIDKAIQKKLLELLPQLVTALGDPAVVAATTPVAREAALHAAAAALAASDGLTAPAVAVAVGINNQAAAAQPAAAVPAAFIQLSNLTFNDAATYYVRLLTGSLAQNTPDAGNRVRYVDRRARSVGGSVATWGTGSDPLRNADLNWNGSAWVGCPLNFENSSTVRDALGNSTYTYCDKRETGKSNRSTFDIGGKTMASVYAQMVAGGYNNFFIANPAVLGTTVFPAGSSVFYQSQTQLTEAFSYYPAGAQNPAGLSNVVSQYSLAVSAGGDATVQANGVACNALETNGNGASSTTLEGMIAAKTGTPCIYAQGTFVYAGATFTSPVPNEWWGNSTVSLGKLGTAPVNSGTAPGYLTGNTLLRAAFKGTGPNAVTYYACKERFNNGSARNCVSIGTGTYAIQTLGDGRALTFANAPVQAQALTYNRVFVERGGLVYFGYQNKPVVSNLVRLNSTASAALLAQLGLTPENPSVPLALTAGSYQGSWDLRATGAPISPTVGTSLFISSNGAYSCLDRVTSTSQVCTLSITNPATGAFTLAGATSTATGSFDFLAGTTAGTFHDTSVTPADGSFVGGRR